ncbi:MAG: sigma-70 family RNA polymerase sigma factor [Bacteroidetes bacterium]|nr:sigma-70 family RNA polymerase sigma factor [Bacteroidota bacterium]MBU1116176.1 sigma-70 family RNA polymerase sigma factor [Bacteroidota bacterium]MBU1799850.1 sigma-70 family RNA polymerase sigma factor [Bacteroidota bacterium]
MKKLTELEIIESVKKGNHGDFALLIDIYKDRAFTLLKKMLKNEMDAEEALQDSFLKVFNSLSDFRAESKFSTWFYRVVYNTALTIISSKKRKIIMEMSSVDDHYDLGDDDKIYSETENYHEYIFKLVDKLPVRNALVIILFYIDGLSLNEISKVLGISLVNTKVLLHRSRNALRDLVFKHNYQEVLL